MQTSDALRVVISCLLGVAALSASNQSAAQSSCSPNGGCVVYPPPGGYPGGGGWGGGGGYGGGWGGETDPSNQSDPPPAVWSAAQCAAFAQQQAQQGCNVNNPPQLMTNGCGTYGGLFVPDFLVSPIQAAVALAFGPVFTDACNWHDYCYGSIHLSKNYCDTTLEGMMVAGARDAIPSVLYPIFQPAVMGQSFAYSRTLAWEQYFPWNTSQNSWNASQVEAQCRNDAIEYRSHGC